MPGKYEVSDITLLNAKIDALQRAINNQNKPPTVAMANTVLCEICGGDDHSSIECQLGMSTNSEQVNATSNYRPQNDPFSNTYNPCWRNHPNFSWRNNQGAAILQQNFQQNKPQQGYQPRQYNQQQQPQKSNLEAMMERFFEMQKKTNDNITKKIKTLTNQNKTLEMQFSQLAQDFASSSRNQGKFSGQPKVNPRESCKAVTLWSEKAYKEPPMPEEYEEQQPAGLNRAPHSADTDRINPMRAASKLIGCTSDQPIDGEQSTDREGGDTQRDKPAYKPPPYRAPVLFPQRLIKDKLEAIR